MKNSYQHYFFGYLALCMSVLSLHAIDNAHFYRATHFFPIYYETRFAQRGLASWDIFISHGATHSARSGDKCNNNLCSSCLCDDTPLLALCGLHNMHALGQGVPGKNPTNPVDLALINLESVPGDDCFGKLLFNGKFSVTEVNIFFTQNLAYGFFVQAHIPVRRLSITDICFIDKSPDAPICRNKNTPAWQTFLNLFPTILEQYHISIDSVHETGIGDISFLLGYAYHYEQTEVLDFIDATARIGILTPSGRTKDQDKAFSLDNGYGGHIGIPFHVTIALGAYEWLTLGTHLGGIVFVDKTKELRMKTSAAQNGFILLAKGTATVNKGTLWNAGVYLKADHVICGFSALVGYSFARKKQDTLSPCDCTIFCPSIANTDCLLKEWKNHAVHLLVEYDFSSERHAIGPRITGFFNWQVGGSHVFKTNVGGLGCGIDLAWCFD